MSVAAILWTHDDRDVLEGTLRHLLNQVDEVIVRHREHFSEVEDILNSIDGLVIEKDTGKHGFNQSALMTDLAQVALERGHSWVVPVDPDEIWYANGARLTDYLAGISWDVGIVRAELFNHVASAQDNMKLHPFKRIGWRQRQPLPLPKVACRLRPDLIIEGGNHSARVGGVALIAGPLLVVRHFPYRTEDQFIHKVRTNYEELKGAGLPESYGAHIRAYGRCLEEEGEDVLRAHFRTWFISNDPKADETLIYDPAPVS